MDELVRNERIKLLANAFNTASTTCFAVGVAAPLAGAVYSNGTFGLTPLFFGVATVSWLLAAIALHLVGRTVLGGLQS
jgi:hypothetical protein